MDRMTEDEKNFIYRWYLWKLLYYFHIETIKSESYSQIKEYYDVWEEALCLNLIIHILLKENKIPFRLWKLIIDILEKFPADGIYVKIEPAEELIKKIYSSSIDLSEKVKED